MDWVRVRELVVFGEVGVYEHEYGRKQRLVFDVEVQADSSQAGKTDALEHAIDYDRIAGCCREVVAAKHHQLIEAIAEEVAERVLAQEEKAREVRVCVKKPGAVPDAATVEVEIRRARA